MRRRENGLILVLYYRARGRRTPSSYPRLAKRAVDRVGLKDDVTRQHASGISTWSGPGRTYVLSRCFELGRELSTYLLPPKPNSVCVRSSRAAELGGERMEAPRPRLSV
jgi:hypothetical protein